MSESAVSSLWSVPLRLFPNHYDLFWWALFRRDQSTAAVLDLQRQKRDKPGMRWSYWLFFKDPE